MRVVLDFNFGLILLAFTLWQELPVVTVVDGQLVVPQTTACSASEVFADSCPYALDGVCDAFESAWRAGINRG